MSTYPHSTFSILQYNFQKSYDVMNILLKNQKTWNYDILAIQEPWLNSHDEKLTHNPTARRFRTFMSTNTDRPLVCFFINNKLDPTSVRFTSRGEHMCSVHITIPTGDGDHTISVHNIYNPHTQDTVYTEGRWEGLPTESTLPEIDIALGKYHANSQVVVGDFNLHHSMWYKDKPMPGARTTRKVQADALIEIMGQYGMELATPPGTITRSRANARSELEGTVLDLSWCSVGGLSDKYRHVGYERT